MTDEGVLSDTSQQTSGFTRLLPRNGPAIKLEVGRLAQPARARARAFPWGPAKPCWRISGGTDVDMPRLLRGKATSQQSRARLAPCCGIRRVQSDKATILFAGQIVAVELKAEACRAVAETVAPSILAWLIYCLIWAVLFFSFFFLLFSPVSGYVSLWVAGNGLHNCSKRKRFFDQISALASSIIPGSKICEPLAART